MNTRRSLDNTHKKFVPAMWGSWTSQLKLNGGDFGILQLKKVTGCGDHHCHDMGWGSIPMKWLHVTLLPAPTKRPPFSSGNASSISGSGIAWQAPLNGVPPSKNVFGVARLKDLESIYTKSPWKPTWHLVLLSICYTHEIPNDWKRSYQTYQLMSLHHTSTF